MTMLMIKMVIRLITYQRIAIIFVGFWVMILCCVVSKVLEYIMPCLQCISFLNVSLKMEVVCYSKTLVTTYQTARCHKPEYHNLG